MLNSTCNLRYLRMTLNMFIDNKAVLFLIIIPLIYFRGCIISDNGRNFIGPEVKEYTRFLNTEWNYIWNTHLGGEGSGKD